MIGSPSMTNFDAGRFTRNPDCDVRINVQALTSNYQPLPNLLEIYMIQNEIRIFTRARSVSGTYTVVIEGEVAMKPILRASYEIAVKLFNPDDSNEAILPDVE